MLWFSFILAMILYFELMSTAAGLNFGKLIPSVVTPSDFKLADVEGPQHPVNTLSSLSTLQGFVYIGSTNYGQTLNVFSRTGILMFCWSIQTTTCQLSSSGKEL